MYTYLLPPIVAHTYVGPSPAELIVFAWLFHLIPLLIVAVPVWLLGKVRVKWNVWDFAIIAFPFVAWFCAATLIHNPSAAFLVLQGLSIGCIALFAPILRVVIAWKLNRNASALALLGVVCLLAGAMGVFLSEDVLLW